MTTDLITNRYHSLTPSRLLDGGITVSTPIYFNIPTDTLKAVLNKFREVKQKQLIDLGWTETSSNGTGIQVTDNTAPPMTPLEQSLEMSESQLRLLLFQRGGLQERIVLKLQQLLDIQIVPRSEIEKTMTQWLDHWYNEPKRVTAPSKTTRARSTRTKVSTDAS